MDEFENIEGAETPVEQAPVDMLADSQAVTPALQPLAVAAEAPARTTKQKVVGVVKLVFALILLYVGLIGQGVALYVAYAFKFDDLMASAIAEAAGVGICALAILLLGGKQIMRLSLSEVGDAFKDCWWMIVADGVTTVLMIWELFADGPVELIDGWQHTVIVCFFLCLFIGLCEEAMFRGLVLGGLMDVTGSSKRGVIVAIVVSALFFGALHVFPADPSEFTPLGILQMVLKTLQTGICGLIWAVVVVKHDSIWGAALVHGFIDFALFAVDGLFYPAEELVDTEYVVTDESGWELVIVYSIVIVTYLPLVVKSIKMMRDIEAPNYGWFYKAPQPVAQVVTVAPVVPATPAVTPVAPVILDSGYAPQHFAQPQQPAAPPPVYTPAQEVTSDDPYAGAIQVPNAQPTPANTPTPQARPVPPKGWTETS